MNNTRSEQSKRNAEYNIEYSKRRRLDGTNNTAETRVRNKEYMRSYTDTNKLILQKQLTDVSMSILSYGQYD
jgi:hypothetical protein